MDSLAGFRLTQRLHVGRRFETWRAERIEDGTAFIVKVALDSQVPQDAANLRHEYDVSSALDLPGVIRAQGLEETAENGVVLLMEDVGGQSLAEFRTVEALEPDMVLNIGVQVADVLGAIHARGVVHKDIKPANLIIRPDTHEVRLTDFGISSRLPRESTPRVETQRLEGTLAYISPEQTGRINRQVDARSDLYSLGATLYELLASRPPFETDDPAELVHAHIARAPQPLSEVAPGTPAALAAIVSKLLNKAAEARYQSAFGLLHDLRRCQANPTESFALGERDVHGVLRLPEELVGRSEQREQLLEAVKRVSAGGREMVMISGAPGIGKSALVAEVERAFAEHDANGDGLCQPQEWPLDAPAFARADRDHDGVLTFTEVVRPPTDLLDAIRAGARDPGSFGDEPSVEGVVGSLDGAFSAR